MARKSESTFAGAGGLNLHAQCWEPEGDARAVVALVHGISEHSGRYGTLVDHLTRAGFAVCSFDHRGHGKSPGRRGHINDWAEYREDVRAFLEHVRQKVPRRRLFLYGHSLGALIVAEYNLHHWHGIAGLILSGVPLKPTGAAKPYLVVIAKLLSRIWPTLTLPLDVDGSKLSRDAAIARAYETDPLVHHKASTQWGAEALRAIDRVRERAADIRLPILILHGGNDQVNAVEGSRELFEKVSSVDKEIRIYPEGAHEPHNDLDREQVAHDVEDWLSRHASATKPAASSDSAR
jgi:alpha-beta hydrolase superfamily lysophospholipase